MPQKIYNPQPKFEKHMTPLKIRTKGQKEKNGGVKNLLLDQRLCRKKKIGKVKNLLLVIHGHRGVLRGQPPQNEN